MDDLTVEHPVSIEMLLASRIHRYDGRPADGPDPAVGQELRDRVEVRAGLGIVGDRFFGHEAHRRYSVTVMAVESLEHVARVLELDEVPDAAPTRRNVILRGIDIDSLRGQTFSIDSGDGPVIFRANTPASPCAWMNEVIAPGAHKALRGRGGMRCEPLSNGTLSLGPAVVRTL